MKWKLLIGFAIMFTVASITFALIVKGCQILDISPSSGIFIPSVGLGILAWLYWEASND